MAGKTTKSDEESRAAKGQRNEEFLWASLLHLRSEAARLEAAAAKDPAKRRELRRRKLQAHLLYRWLQPSLGLLWAETLGHTSYRQTWMYVTDGGHYDNLGLVAALRNNNDRIVVLDAAGDPTDRWSTTGGAIALARVDAGFSVDLDPSQMRPEAGPNPKEPALARGEVHQPWIRGTFDGSRDGQLWVCKLGWWHDSSWDVRAYAAAHPKYPCDSTAQQLYDADEFEAYRSLGHQAVEAAIKDGHLQLDPPQPLWQRLKDNIRGISSSIVTRVENLDQIGRDGTRPPAELGA